MDKTIRLQVATCTLDIIPDAYFSEMPLETQRRLLRGVFRSGGDNKRAIAELGEYLHNDIQERKDILLSATLASKKEPKSTSLKDKVKKCKSDYDRAVKITIFFDALYEKYKTE